MTRPGPAPCHWGLGTLSQDPGDAALGVVGEGGPSLASPLRIRGEELLVPLRERPSGFLDTRSTCFARSFHLSSTFDT